MIIKIEKQLNELKIINNICNFDFSNSPLTPLGKNRKKINKNLSAKNNEEKMTSPLRSDPSGHTTEPVTTYFIRRTRLKRWTKSLRSEHTSFSASLRLFLLRDLVQWRGDDCFIKSLRDFIQQRDIRHPFGTSDHLPSIKRHHQVLKNPSNKTHSPALLGFTQPENQRYRQNFGPK